MGSSAPVLCFIVAFAVHASALTPVASAADPTSIASKLTDEPFAATPIATAPHRELTSVRYQGGYGTGSSYGQRNQNSWIGFLIGIALLFIAPMLLVMTEIQGVKITRLINRAQVSTLANIPSAHVDPKLDGFMVHMTGPLSVADDGSGYVDKDTGVAFGSGALSSARVNPATFAFPVRGVGAEALVASNPMRIMRTVEVYQWVEQEEQDANSTDYVYHTGWFEVDIPSRDFHVRGSHENPTSRVVNLFSSEIDRPSPCIGAFALGKEALTKADWWADAHVHPGASLSPALASAGARVVQMETCMGIYIPSGQRPVDQFAIGDMRITFKTVEMPASEATVVGVQQGAALRPYTNADAAKTLGRQATPRASDEVGEEDARSLQALLNGGNANCCTIFGAVSSLFAKLLLMVMRHVVGTEVLLLSPLSKGVMRIFLSENMRVERALSTFRIVGAVLFVASFYLILHPIAALFSFIPFLGKLIASLFLVAAIIVGLACAITTTVATWLVVKPLRACLGFVALGGLYALELYFEPSASVEPLYTFGALAAVAGILSLWELYNDCKFQQAARSGLAGASYVQVGMPLAGGAKVDGGAQMAQTAKTMV